jgi:hypothetical protein
MPIELMGLLSAAQQLYDQMAAPAPKAPAGKAAR